MMKDQLYNILEKLIIKHNISVNKEELKLQFSSHPSYPSLHALTGVLEHFSIPNLALQLTTNKEALSQLPKFFIARLNTKRGNFLSLIEKKEDYLKVLNDRKEDLDFDSFLKLWDGIVVVIEKDEAIIQEQNDKSFSNLLKWVFYPLSVFIIGATLYTINDAFGKAHFILSIIGVLISIFIVKHELGLKSSVSNSICNLSSKTSCDAVLESKGASLFRILKLSDLSIVTFSTYCLSWGFYAISSNTNFPTMSIVTLLTFPFIFYSIYYQYNVVKKWCPLCLSISLVLILQIALLPLTKTSLSSLDFDLKSLGLFVLSLTLAITIWSFIKPLLVKKQELSILQIEHFKFKRNFSLFNALYNQSEKLTHINYFPNELVFGNPNAAIELILVTNPLCYFCKSAHSDVEMLLKKLEGKIKVIIRFKTNGSSKDSVLYKTVSQLLHIYNTHGETSALKALDEVYTETIDLEKWIKNQSLEVDQSYDYTLNEQHNWCQANAINFTPALFINNTLFPKEYDRSDLIYFIDDLIEQQEDFIPPINKHAFAS